MNKQKYWILPIIFLLAQTFFAQHPAEFVRSYAKQHDFSGTVLIKNDSKIIYEESFGMANRQFAVLNKPDTKYKVASITKAFTSVLILQLYEQGKIDLNVPFQRRSRHQIHHSPTPQSHGRNGKYRPQHKNRRRRH